MAPLFHIVVKIRIVGWRCIFLFVCVYVSLLEIVCVNYHWLRRWCQLGDDPTTDDGWFFMGRWQRAEREREKEKGGNYRRTASALRLFLYSLRPSLAYFFGFLDGMHHYLSDYHDSP